MKAVWKFVPIGLASLVVLTGCHLDMYQQPKIKSQSENKVYADGEGTRLPVAGTIEFGKPKKDVEFFTGYKANGRLVTEMPIKVTEAVVKRGQERFNIYCQHCHGAAGDGKGMIAQRGFELARPVGNYHTPRLREMPVGHFFDVISNGYGTMYGHASRINPYDRWAIVSYIRALQISQSVLASDMDAETQAKFGVKASLNSGPLFVPPVTAPVTVPNPGPVDGVTPPQRPVRNGRAGE
ncbi:MAG: c-type cytochrome [Fimbriimonadaceae bacterium]